MEAIHILMALYIFICIFGLWITFRLALLIIRMISEAIGRGYKGKDYRREK